VVSAFISASKISESTYPALAKLMREISDEIDRGGIYY